MLKPGTRHVGILLLILAVLRHPSIVIDPFDYVNKRCGLCGEHPGDPCMVEGSKRGIEQRRWVHHAVLHQVLDDLVNEPDLKGDVLPVRLASQFPNQRHLLVHDQNGPFFL